MQYHITQNLYSVQYKHWNLFKRSNIKLELLIFIKTDKMKFKIPEQYLP
jgi:hypothetical protein